MNIVKRLVIAAAIIPAVLGSVSVWAVGGNMARDCGPNGFGGKMMRTLNLTPDQVDQMRVIRHEMYNDRFDRMQAKRKDMRTWRADQQTLMLAKQFDTAKATELAEKMVDDSVSYRVERMKLHHKMIRLLTPEQKTKLAGMMNQGMPMRLMDHRGFNHGGYHDAPRCESGPRR